MTDLKFALLDMLYHTVPTKPLTKIDLLNSGHDKVYNIEAALKDLMTQSYISATYGSDTVKITSTGRIAYEAAKEERQQQTKNERQQRFDNKISVASVLIPLITFVLGLTVEHFSGLVAWLVSLFT